MPASRILTPDYARNMRIVGHSDQGGRSDGVQVMVSGGYAYVGHVFSGGFSIIDVYHTIFYDLKYRRVIYPRIY